MGCRIWTTSSRVSILTMLQVLGSSKNLGFVSPTQDSVSRLAEICPYIELIEKHIHRQCSRRIDIEARGKTTMAWRVYLLRCADDSLYCGISKDLEARIAQHNAGKGAKYTRSRLPVKLVAASDELSRSEALKVEHAVKQQPASRKVDALKGRIDLQGEK